MIKKLAAGLLCILIVITTMAGCGKKLTENGIYVHKNGTIESAVFEAFDSKTYDEAELQTYLEGVVIAYNKEAAGVEAAYAKDAKDVKEGLPVAIDSFEVKDNQAILKMSYASAKDYLDFNVGDDSLTELTYGTVVDMKSLGVDAGKFELVNASGEAYTEELADELHFVVAEGNQKLLFEGKIICASKGVSLEDKDTVVITADAGTSITILK